MQDVQKFREHDDIRIETKIGDPTIKNKIPDESFRYGKANRPSTPIDHVISKIIF